MDEQNPFINVNYNDESEHEQRIDISEEEHSWGTWAHLAGLLGFLIPFGSLLGPLLIWQTKGKESAYIEEQSKEVLNFQLSVAIYTAVAGLLCIILIGIPLLFVALIGWLVLSIIGTVKANKGILYKYKYNLRLIK
ncbi:MAG: DUF4870 domain-containing protein [Bacteroidia bacterium]